MEEGWREYENIYQIFQMLKFFISACQRTLYVKKNENPSKVKLLYHLLLGFMYLNYNSEFFRGITLYKGFCSTLLQMSPSLWATRWQIC
jgi:hypothetical protein